MALSTDLALECMFALRVGAASCLAQIHRQLCIPAAWLPLLCVLGRVSWQDGLRVSICSSAWARVRVFRAVWGNGRHHVSVSICL